MTVVKAVCESINWIELAVGMVVNFCDHGDLTL
jgi:hypothetical protein